jgi:hypothetical protein
VAKNHHPFDKVRLDHQNALTAIFVEIGKNIADGNVVRPISLISGRPAGPDFDGWRGSG